MNMVDNNKKINMDKILMVFFVLVIIMITLITYMSTNYISKYTDLIQKNIEERLFAECRAIQNMVSIEELESYQVPADMKKEEYQSLQAKLAKYAKDHELMFVYYMRMMDDGKIQYIIDSDPNPETNYGLDHFEEPYELAEQAFDGIPTYNLIGEYEPGWDGIMSAYIPIFDDNGNVVAIAGVDIDDTEIVKRRDRAHIFTLISVISASVLGGIGLIVITRYHNKARVARSASVAKGQFLSKMSHEMRTPLNAIIGFSRMAKNTTDIKKKNECLDNISSSSDYLLELINGVLDLTKIESNKMTLNLEKISLQQTFRDIHIILDSQIVKKTQSLAVDISNDIPQYVYCDETRFKQVIVNLASNAIKFTPEQGKISIKGVLIEKKNNFCNLEFIVSDNGIGIKEETLSKLFNAFEQGDGSITRKYGGIGLGLAISKHFVELMEGSISVSSKEGEGSTFKFNVWLEIVPEEEVLIIENTEVELEKDLDCTGNVFLVAEDSMVNQIIEKDILEGFGATLEFANNGAQCVEMFKQNPDKYDMIFMDIQMPEMDGLEATKQIRTSGIEVANKIPIVAMTAEVFQEDINNALNSGMNDHLGKPLKVAEIKEVIKKNLNK